MDYSDFLPFALKYPAPEHLQGAVSTIRRTGEANMTSLSFDIDGQPAILDATKAIMINLNDQVECLGRKEKDGIFTAICYKNFTNNTTGRFTYANFFLIPFMLFCFIFVPSWVGFIALINGFSDLTEWSNAGRVAWVIFWCVILFLFCIFISYWVFAQIRTFVKIKHEIDQLNSK